MSAFIQDLSQLLGQAAPTAQAVGAFVNPQPQQPAAGPAAPGVIPGAGQPRGQAAPASGGLPGLDVDRVFDGNRWLFQKVRGLVIGSA
jgi:hypothetical protein